MYLPPMSMVAKVQLVSAVGTLVHSDIPYMQGLPSQLQGFELQIVQLYGKVSHSSSFVAPPLGLSCGFSLISVCGLPTVLSSSGCPGALGSALVRTGCRGGMAAGAVGALTMTGVWGVSGCERSSPTGEKVCREDSSHRCERSSPSGSLF